MAMKVVTMRRVKRGKKKRTKPQVQLELATTGKKQAAAGLVGERSFRFGVQRILEVLGSISARYRL